MVPMTSSTASTGGLFDTPFSIGATVLAAVAALVGVLFAWTGYAAAGTDEATAALPLLGFELNILTGFVGLLFAFGIALVALVAALYMEPGFGE
ncbi:hypothetical protein C488_05708 [Natrinema pellirubrum DSM 15624]|uniref:Uncharacterized protein n=2 Tax=Natrinema pellirubrum (strain DSM 15624 / CIP 106293 / JCM 10476 / NCIMB 786 / 157) TaxID=797303 RepID=L9YVD9_NATP1|nr:hypothetical protein [Natrinema pellirubrum]ELY78069.1 hypothetical protein C488_05708 [Natrinema pellirubrum DSM 15624]